MPDEATETPRNLQTAILGRDADVRATARTVGAGAATGMTLNSDAILLLVLGVMSVAAAIRLPQIWHARLPRSRSKFYVVRLFQRAVLPATVGFWLMTLGFGVMVLSERYPQLEALILPIGAVAIPVVVLTFVVHSFGWPRFLVPPHLRDLDDRSAGSADRVAAQEQSRKRAD